MDVQFEPHNLFIYIKENFIKSYNPLIVDTNLR